MRAVLDAGLGQQVPVAWLCPVWPEFPIPYQYQHELTGYSSVGPVLYPSAEASPMQKSLVEVLMLQIHLSGRC